jgi:hypothetical protein
MAVFDVWGASGFPRSEFRVAIRQVMLDTLSHVLGVLDGSSLNNTGTIFI